MIQKVNIIEKNLNQYKDIVGDSLLAQIEKLSLSLKGIRICHLSTTPFGGGISEILFSTLPLELHLGLQIDWYTLKPDEQFFTIGKNIHNALQGDGLSLSNTDKSYYVNFNQSLSSYLHAQNYDCIIVHSNHFLPLPEIMSGQNTMWVWRCHLDTSEAQEPVWEFLMPFTEHFRGVVFSASEYIPAGLNIPLIKTIAPAIDPLSPKNRDLPRDKCQSYMRELGINPDMPVLLHASRLDHWKNPIGLIKCYYMAKDYIPELQLVITNSMALDDPETFTMLRTVDAEAAKDEDMHVYTNMDGIGDFEVNALQRASHIGIMTSTHEGFGLSISETLWKKRPALATNTIGSIMQLQDRLSYCLFDSIEKGAEKIVTLLQKPQLGDELAELGHIHIKNNFLTPRLIRDELELMLEVMD